MRIPFIDKLFLQDEMIKDCKQMPNLMDVYSTSYIRMKKQHVIMMLVYL